MKQEYELLCSGTAPTLYPTYLIWGLLLSGEDIMEVPKRLPFAGEWGESQSNVIPLRDCFPLPESMNVFWLSITERKLYSAILPLPVEEMEKEMEESNPETGGQLFSHLVIGMAPYGRTAFWLRGNKKSEFVLYQQANEIEGYEDIVKEITRSSSIDEVCDFYINNDERVRENLEVNGLPARDLFDRYMQQFCYRYLVMFERWDEDEERWVKPELDEEGQPVDGKPLPVFDFIEEVLWDGTHDKLHDGGLMSYHQAGKPKKLALEWHIKKSQYSAYLWFEDELIRAAFEKFYGAHRDTKVDFIIRIDPEKNKYELALYRYGLQEPVVISEDAYQMIVFKSKFEYYRSENYDQPRGAWIW